MIETVIKKMTGGLDGIVEDLISSATEKLRVKVTEAFALNKLTIFKENVKRIGQVKTIFSPDEIVNLDDMFFEKAVLFDHEYIASFSKFESKHILVEGGPGQGKSLFLRKLCITEGSGSSFIPIFIEFRNLKYKGNLKEELIGAIGDLGVRLDNELFDFLANSEKIILLLDGFDEVPNSERDRVARELETIVRAFQNLKIVVSSRPDSGMGSSFYFSKRKISPMALDTQVGFVKNLYKENGPAESINKILSSSDFISEVTTTPLLLSLFSITYSARQFKPDSLSEFYSLLFPTMLYRHDRMKIGFERERKSKLTDYKMQKVFDALSFLSLNDDCTRFPMFSFQTYLEQSAKLEGLPDDIEDLLIDDITSITALVVRDGYDYYSYTHKSIQEFFAATYISRLSEERKVGFYSFVLSDFHEFMKWQNTLAFLETIDERSYIKFFLIPFKKESLCLNDKYNIAINYKSFLKLVGSDSKLRISEGGDLVDVYWGDTFSSVLYVEYSVFSKKVIREYLKGKAYMVAEYLSYCDEDDYEYFKEIDGDFVVNLDRFITENKIRVDVCKYLSSRFEDSNFKIEVLSMEEALNDSDMVMDYLLPF